MIKYIKYYDFTDAGWVMMKRILCILLVFALMSTGAVFAADPTVYTASLSSDTLDVLRGDTVKVNIEVDSESKEDFASSEVVITYDNTVLSFSYDDSTLNGAEVVEKESGRLVLEDYGSTQELGTAYVFAFTALTDGEAEVVLQSANFSDSQSAVDSNLFPASVPDGTKSVTVTVRVGAYDVELNTKLFKGADTATEGEDYTFSKSSDGAYYDYGTISATMGGQTVQVIDNGDGTYTIENVTGKIVVSGTRSAKKYQVDIGGEVLSSDGNEATYGKDYKFTLKADVPSGEEEGSTYVLSYIKIGGRTYKGYKYDSKARVYTIPGKDIKGKIEIGIETVTVPVQSYTVTLDSAVGTVDGEYPVIVQYGKSHTFTITPEEGYTYTVTATMGGEEVEVVKGENNTYTVEEIVANVVIKISATVPSDKLTANHYVTLDGTVMWLVLNKTDKLETGVYTLNGENMLWSDKYDAYCYLVIGKEVPELVLGITGGETADVVYGDTDLDGETDTDDASFIWNVYGVAYNSFTEEVTAEMCLRADYNGSGHITVEDASAVLSIIQ